MKKVCDCCGREYEGRDCSHYGCMVARREETLTGRKAEPGICIVGRFEKGEKK